MYLSRKLKPNGYHLLLMESIHVPGKKNPKKVQLEDYGLFDKVSPHLREAYENKKIQKAFIEEQKQKRRLAAADIAARAADQAKDSQPESAGRFFNRAFALRYGHLPLKPIWDKELNLRWKIDYLQKHKTEIESWRLNDILFYLCALKAIEPRSYHGAYGQKGDFFYCPWSEVALDNFYRALDFACEHGNALIEHAVKSRLKNKKTEVKVAFFDCTNTWFETPYDDLVWQIMRFRSKIRKELKKEGVAEESIAEYLESEAFAEELAHELSLKKDDILRMRGKSKEGKFAQPLVTVALAIDQTGFPIDCQVYAGNLSELKTLKPMLESLKKKYAVKDVYFVADRGLNSTENLKHIKDEKLGFVVAQKVSNQKEALRKIMLDPAGYSNCGIDKDGRFYRKEGEANPDAFRFKVIDHVKKSRVDVENPEENNGVKTKQITVPCSMVFTFSPERRARDLADLENQITRANKAIQEQALMGNPFGTGWRALVQTEKEAAQTKEEKDQYRACGLKQSVIEERRAIAGYAALVFSHPDGEKAQKLTDEEVLSTYHELVNIEDCFRVMKSTFSIRPVYVRLNERIKGHCYLCVLALMLIKSLQERMDAKGWHYSTAKLSDGLGQALALLLPAKEGLPPTFVNTSLNPGVYQKPFAEKGRYRKPENALDDCEQAWDNYKKHRENTPFIVDQILLASGLQPLPVFADLGEMKRKLGVHTYKDAVLIAPEHMKLSIEAGKNV